MSAVTDENAGTVALLEATAEARTLIEDVSRLAEELKVRQERLGELLTPSEAALRARTEYLDKVMREHLVRAEQRITAAAEELRGLRGHGEEIYGRALAAATARLPDARPRPWRLVLQLLAMLLGGFLAGQVASYRSGVTAEAKPAVIEETTPAPKKSAPMAPRRPAGSSAKPAPAAR
jgi:hypothetical protein